MKLLLLVGILAMLPTSSLLPVYAQVSTADWFGPSGNYPLNWNYNPQKTINSTNAANLVLRWAFPVPAAPPSVPRGSEGVIVTPVIMNGIVYFITNWHTLYALDARDGKIVWTRPLPVNMTSLGTTRLSLQSGHYHAIWSTRIARGVPLIWVVADNYTIFAVNALTGDINLRFDAFNVKERIPGNFGDYDTLTPSIVIDDQRGILIFGSSGSEGTDSGRGFLRAFDINSNPPRLLWTTFIIPPQDGSDPNWSIKSVQNMSYAYIFDAKTGQAIDLKSLSPQQLHDLLYADWGDFGFNGTHSFAGANLGWGGTWAVDPQTGIAYIGTAQPAPDWNATFRPGPNLWSDSILAVDVKTGRIIWAFQTLPHDMYDYDCAWSVLLANATVNGQQRKVVFKGCKDGYFFALDASTGGMLWYFNPPSIKYSKFVRISLHDPFNKTMMTLPWQNYPSTEPFIQNPPSTGGIEMNPAYDPTTNTIYFVSYNSPLKFTLGPVKGPGVPWGVTGRASFSPTGVSNSTLWALDANTGKPLWSYDIPNVGFRGGVDVSGGVVYVPSGDGFMRLLDAKTGKLIGQILIGAAMITQPAIGQDSAGEYRIVIPVAASQRGGLWFGIGLQTPGYVAALALPENVPISIRTTTQLSTITQTVPGPTTGIAPEAFYGAVAVAVIFVIATGVLAARRRAPS